MQVIVGMMLDFVGLSGCCLYLRCWLPRYLDLLPHLDNVASDCCLLLITDADRNYDAQLGESVALLPRSNDACGLVPQSDVAGACCLD